MDIQYKTFASRNTRNIRFDQLHQQPSLQQNQTSMPVISASLSPRKRVNVVSFTPQGSTEVITQSPEKIELSDSNGTFSELPKSEILSTASLTITTNQANCGIKRFSSTSSDPTNAITLLHKQARFSSVNLPLKPTTTHQMEPVRADNSGQSKCCSSISRPLGAPAKKFLQSSNQSTKQSFKGALPAVRDPYEWADVDEEDDSMETTNRENGLPAQDDEVSDDEDDDVKPWFWPASRASDSLKKKENVPTTDSNSLKKMDNSTKKFFVQREQKPLFTVVKKVKDAFECQERGEFQHALDDINYLIDGFADTNNVNTRSLSILSLAKKCLTASSRDLIHAYGLIKHICDNLHDAHTDYALSLTTAGLFFILSRDHDPDMLTSSSLALVLKLLQSPTSITAPENVPGPGGTGISSASKYSSFGPSRQARLNKETSQIRTHVQQLLESVSRKQQNQRLKNKTISTDSKNKLNDSVNAKSPFENKGKSLFSGFSSSPTNSLNTRHLRLNRQLTARDLILETLLNLGTRKAGAWFKSDLRTGGGIDEIAEVTIDAVDYLKDLRPGVATHCFTDRLLTRQSATGLDDFALDKLKRVSYYAKLLENMTYMNRDNQSHLVRYKDRLLMDRLTQCICLCASRLPRHAPPSVAWANLRTVSNLPTSTLENEASSSTGGCSQRAELTQVEHQPDQKILLGCLLAIFRLLVNVSHSEYASDRLGGCPGLLETTLDCLFHLPERLPASRRFDWLVLILCLLANLCEHCPENRIRIVHLELPSSEVVTVSSVPKTTSAASSEPRGDVKLTDVDYDDDGQYSESDCVDKKITMIAALDEIVKLFLYRELQTMNHDFERDDSRLSESVGVGISGENNLTVPSSSSCHLRATTEADSTTNSLHILPRPKPPPSLLDQGETIEEAGLKWRLIGDRKASNCLTNRSNFKLDNKKANHGTAYRRRRRRLALIKLRNRRLNPHLKHSVQADIDEEDDEDDDDDEEGDEDDEDEFDCDDELTDEDEEDEDDDDDDVDSIGGGADVEFVTETQEEQDKLAERMSSANQHMEDSVVAAYAALLLGCILQSSPRYAERIRTRLPDGKFRPLAIMLAKLLSFLSLAKGVETAGSESILRIVRVLEAQDQQPGCQQVVVSTKSSSFPATRLTTRTDHY